MSPVNAFTADDFAIAPRGPRLYDRWIASQPVQSPLGPFDVELYQPPDEALLRSVNELGTFVSTEYDAVLVAVYEHYQRVAEDRNWMRGCGVPSKLLERQIIPYLRSRSIVVRRDKKGIRDATIYISPLWDVEHGICLAICKGRLFQRPP